MMCTASALACSCSGLGDWQQQWRWKPELGRGTQSAVRLRFPPGRWLHQEGTSTRRLDWSDQRRGRGVVRAEGTSGLGYGGYPVFPRINVRDPHKRLGVSKEASLEEVQDARSYLISLYGEHPESKNAIESAYDRIFMDSLKQRKRAKPSQVKKLVQPPKWMQFLSNRVEVPSQRRILTRAACFAMLAIWTGFDKTPKGPAFQVLLSFLASLYFLNERLMKPWKAVVLGFVVLIGSWLISTLLWPILPAQVLPKSWGIELVSSLISYVFLFCGSTYLK